MLVFGRVHTFPGNGWMNLRYPFLIKVEFKFTGVDYKWFPYRVSIHHPLGFNCGTLTGRCWHMLFNFRCSGVSNILPPILRIAQWPPATKAPAKYQDSRIPVAQWHSLRRKSETTRNSNQKTHVELVVEPTH